jgi:cytochrome c oxidase subunit 2
VADLWWLMFGLAAVVVAFVCVMLLAGIVRSRRRTGDPRRPVRWGEPLIVIGGIVVTGIVLVFVFVVSIRDLRAIAGGAEDAKLTVEVIGHDWWWEARYPNGAVTANEIHVPAGEKIRLELGTDDVIHSFWVPQLGPKTDMIPGRVNVAVLEASEPGRYRGQCAEYCGLQHANMALWIVADARPDFERWLRNEGRPARSPRSALALRGERIFMESTCAGCHAVRGTEAAGTLGPDLTHLARRETIAADTLRLTTSNLGSWIVDPHERKPGAAMPPNDQLSAREVAALVAYLRGLR